MNYAELCRVEANDLRVYDGHLTGKQLAALLDAAAALYDGCNSIHFRDVTDALAAADAAAKGAE